MTCFNLHSPHVVDDSFFPGLLEKHAVDGVSPQSFSIQIAIFQQNESSNRSGIGLPHDVLSVGGAIITQLSLLTVARMISSIKNILLYIG